MSNFSETQNRLLSVLRELRLKGMANALENQFVNEVTYSSVSFDERLNELLVRQEAYKKESAYRRLLTNGKLKYMTNFNELHFSENDGISKPDLQYLLSNNWVFTRPANIIIQGMCGVGKTSLACCLLNNVAKEGGSVRFCRMSELSNEVLISAQDPKTMRELLKRYSGYKVLALDDFGLEKLESVVLSFLYNLVDAIMPGKPLIITSQLKVTNYSAYLGGGAQAEAIVDRLVKPCKIITLEGESKREALKE